MGGTDDKSNIICLTLREHYIAHMLLWKCYGRGMTYAFNMMTSIPSRGPGIRLTSRQYESLRRDVAKQKKGVPRSEETKKKISAAKKGRPGTNSRVGKTIHPVELRICLVCGKEFEVRVGMNGSGKCCSRSCAGKYGTKIRLERGTGFLAHPDNRGRKYIHKENQIRAVRESELAGYIKNGWELGRN